MVRPKARPNTQNKIPKSSNRWPSIPRKVTEDKSGNLRLASPPTDSGAGRACVTTADKRIADTITAPADAARHPRDHRHDPCDQMLMIAYCISCPPRRARWHTCEPKLIPTFCLRMKDSLMGSPLIAGSKHTESTFVSGKRA